MNELLIKKYIYIMNRTKRKKLKEIKRATEAL